MTLLRLFETDLLASPGSASQFAHLVNRQGVLPSRLIGQALLGIGFCLCELAVYLIERILRKHIFRALNRRGR